MNSLIRLILLLVSVFVKVMRPTLRQKDVCRVCKTYMSLDALKFESFEIDDGVTSVKVRP